MRLISAFVLVSMALVACNASDSSEPETSQNADLTADTNPINQKRFAILEGMMPDLGKAAAADFAKMTATPAFGDLVSTKCLGPKTADARYPRVSFADCRFTFKTASGGSTTFSAVVGAAITIPGMPDYSKPNDPVTHEPPPATETTVTHAEAYNEYIVSGDVPALPAPIAMSDESGLEALGRAIAGRFETKEFGEEGGECGDLSRTPPKFAASEGVKTYCYTYFVDDDLFHGELLLALQTDHHGKATGIRYFTFGGFD
jgi:hypothetical protein